jgi:hypothetical protein
MANEIQYQIQLKLNNGDLSDTFTTSSQRIDQTSAILIRNVQEIGNTAEGLVTPDDMVAPGYALFQNLEAAGGDTVEVGNFTGGTFYPFALLKPGEMSLVRLAVTAAELYAKASATTVNLFYIIYDD